MDLTEDPAGRATAFATACAGTWVFIRNMVMRPAIKSCHQRIADLVEDRDRLIARVDHLEMALFTSGIPELRKAMQAAVSENHIEIAEVQRKLEGQP